MRRRIVATAATTIATLTAGGVIAPDASARTPSWLAVRTQTKAAAYNGGRAVVAPKATAAGARVVTSLRITAYRGSKRVASGRTVRLKPGKYRTVTSGTYRAYRLVNEVRTRQVLHAADYTTASCVVSSAVDDGFGGTTSQASCTNPYYPTQPKADEEYATYQVGDTYSEYFLYDDEYVSERYNVTVRAYGATGRFSSVKRALKVRNGGYRRVFRGSGSLDTGNFRTPRADYRLTYSFSCSDRDNFIIWVRRPNGDYVDLAANDLDYSGSGAARLHGGGRIYLEITTFDDCGWRVSIK